MNPKPPFAPFTFDAPVGAPLFASPAANPFMDPVAEAAPAQPVDAVWCQDMGADDDDAGLPAPEAIDVRILWGTNVLHFEQMSPPRPFTLGGAGSDFILPEGASATDSCPLVLVRGGEETGVVERASVFVAPGATVEVRLVNDTRLSLAECLAKGLAQASASHAGAYEILLPHGATATQRLHGSDLTFEVSRARARLQPDPGFLAGADLSGQIYTGLSALAHATLVGALAFFLPAMHGDDAEAIDRNAANAMMPYMAAIAERAEEPQPIVQETAPAAASGGGSGSAAELPGGKMGSTVAHPEPPGRYAVRGDAEETQVARARALEEASTFGMLSLLSGTPTDAPIAAWGGERELGRDARSANGAMWDQSINDALGVGGLALSGTDEGGGGKSHGIGLDGIGSTIGHGSGDLGGDGPGRGPGHSYGPPGTGFSHAPGSGGHVSRGPHVTPNPLTTFSGNLPRDVVQRVIRLNFGRFRLCYEAGLLKNPGLTGRVAVKFMIGRDGAVSFAATDPSTDMADETVTACVVRGFQNLSFPAPEGGTVQVVYPLTLTPGE